MSNPQGMDPERAAWMHRTVTDLSARFLSRMLADLDSSTEVSSRSPSERLALAALRPWLPKLARLVSDRISSADPAALERMAGALATGIEDVLAAAPGDPLPRWRPGWDPADGSLVLVPLEGPALLELEQCPECPHLGGIHDELLGCTGELETGAGCPCRRVGCGCAAVA